MGQDDHAVDGSGKPFAPALWVPLPLLSLGYFYGIAAGVGGLLLWLTISLGRTVYSGLGKLEHVGRYGSSPT